MNKIVAIQGGQGSNHYKVVHQLYGTNAQLIECMSFDVLVDRLLDGSATHGVMAIENTIAGSILPNYALIDTHDLHIVGEAYLHIHHHLMALPDQLSTDIREVWSHPMTLLQCKDFFKKHPHIKLVEDIDTAEIAKRIAREKLVGIAAIAPKIAAEIFDLQILEYEIQTIKNNATRFVIVQVNRPKGQCNEVDKASVKFELDHKRGSLAAILNAMSDCKLSLTKVQSLPKIETPWKYAFFVDVTFDAYEDYVKAKTLVGIMASKFKILGAYKSKRNESF